MSFPQNDFSHNVAIWAHFSPKKILCVSHTSTFFCREDSENSAPKQSNAFEIRLASLGERKK
jgi:hypothetical protein